MPSGILVNKGLEKPTSSVATDSGWNVTLTSYWNRLSYVRGERLGYVEGFSPNKVACQ